MSLAQIANYALPLVVLPYITRVVGPANYGIIEFATVTLLYFIVIVEYSFYTTATRKIAALANNRERVSFYFSNVMTARALLFLAALCIFTICMLSIPTFKEHQLVLWLAFPIVAGWMFYPNFLFQGIQKLAVIAFANVIVKGMAAALIFVFINQKGDYFLVTFINGISQLVVGVFTFWYAFKTVEGLVWKKPDSRAVKAVLWDGRFVFLSNFFTRVYGFSTIFLAPFLLTELQTGLFAAASKLITVSQSFLFQPLYGALFPFLSEKLSKGLGHYRKGFRKALLLLSGASLLASGALALLAPYIVHILYGNDYQESSRLIMIMAPMLFLGGLIHMHLQQGLLILRKDKIYMTIVIIAGFISVGLNLVIVPLFELTGAALVKLLIEAAIAGLAIYYFYKKLRELHAKG